MQADPSAAPDDPSATQPAGLILRMAAIVYDAFLLLALWMVGGALYLVGTGGEPAAPGDWFYPLYNLGIAYLFLVGFWLHAGQTAGMRAWRLRVVMRDGSRPTLGALSVRFGAALLSWVLLGGGFLVALLDRERRTLHDRLSGTRLLREARQRPLDPPGRGA